MDESALTHLTESALFRLPPELRLRIYEYIYNGERGCSLIARNNRQVECFKLPCFGCAGPAALLRTCKEVYREAAPVLYSTTTFKILLFGLKQPEMGTLAPFCPLRSCLALRHTRNLELVLHLRDNHDLKPILNRLTALVQQLPPERELKSCSVHIVLYSHRSIGDYSPSYAVLDHIRGLERKPRLREPNLRLVRQDIYRELWKEAVRVVQRFHPDQSTAHLELRGRRLDTS